MLHVYVYVYTYMFGNTFCSVCIMLLIYAFSEMTIWYLINNYYVIPCVKLFLAYEPLFNNPQCTFLILACSKVVSNFLLHLFNVIIWILFFPILDLNYLMQIKIKFTLPLPCGISLPGDTHHCRVLFLCVIFFSVYISLIIFHKDLTRKTQELLATVQNGR